MYFESIKRALELLNTSENGLSSEEAQKRLKLYGKNEIEEKKESNLKIFLKKLFDPLNTILLIGGILSIIIGNSKESILIFAVIIINTLIEFYFESKISKEIESLKNIGKVTAKVIRDGKLIEIDSSEIVVGDIIEISEGDVVPADARLIYSSGLLVDESPLTGEYFPVEKDHNVILPEGTPIYERKNCVFKGTLVLSGKGKAVVYATGLNTEIGKIYLETKEKTKGSPFIENYKKFVKVWLTFNLILFSIFYPIAIFLYKIDMLYFLIFIISNIVSIVPVGLPLAITLSLVVGVRRLARRKFLVKHLSAVEALGSIEYLLIDKTGTITEGKLSVDKYFTIDEENLHIISALCNSSDGKFGDPLDLALLRWLETKGIDWKTIRKDYKIEWEHPFDPNRRLMAVVVKKDNKKYLLVKGAYESLLERTYYVHKDIHKLYEEYTKKGLRVIAFGYREVDRIPADVDNIKIKIIGIVGFSDSIRKDINDIINIVKKLGIRIIMITGDNLNTAKYIGERVGILEKDGIILEGKDLDVLNDEELYDVIKRTNIIARALPEHKFRVVKVLKEKNHVVGMFGDGINDAPALKISDVGITIENGTNVAKESSKVIIPSKDLSIIVDAIVDGRKIVRSISGLVRYLTSVNLSESFYNFSSLFLLQRPGIYPVQILWINLITDGCQDKAFAFTKHNSEKLTELLKAKDVFFGKKQLLSIFSTAILMTFLHLFLLFIIIHMFTYEKAITIVVLSIILSSWVVGIHEISEESIIKNPINYIKSNVYIYIGILIGIILQIFALNYLNSFLHFSKIDMDELLLSLIIPISLFAFIEIRKFVLNKYI